MGKDVKVFIILILTLFVVGGLISFTLLFTSISPQPKEPIPPKEVPSVVRKEIMVEIYEGKIEPRSFGVKIGQEVALTIVSMEGEHSLRFEDEKLAGIGGDFDEPGETLKITFTAPEKPGEYLFYCQKEGHRAKGEEGTMVVE